MSRFTSALNKRVCELGIEPLDLTVKKFDGTCPPLGSKVLYFFVNHGVLDYIGMTRTFQKRMNRHKHSGYNKLRNRTGIYYMIQEISYEELRDLEASLIQLLQPKNNLQA